MGSRSRASRQSQCLHHLKPRTSARHCPEAQSAFRACHECLLCHGSPVGIRLLDAYYLFLFDEIIRT